MSPNPKLFDLHHPPGIKTISIITPPLNLSEGFESGCTRNPRKTIRCNDGYLLILTDIRRKYNTMSKRPYQKPQVFDFSLEGITGIGAADCVSGSSFIIGPCEAGRGASGNCGGGNSASGNCGEGVSPSYPGVLCRQGAANAGNCYDGGAASGSRGLCFVHGNSATYLCFTGTTAQNPPICNSDGSANAAFCRSGNSQVNNNGS